MAGKKKKEARKAKKEKVAEESEDSDAGESSGTADAPIEIESAGDQDSPIEINCQYPTAPSYHDGHVPVPRFTAVPSAPSSFALPGSRPPPPQYYFHQFPTNHDCLRNTGAQEDSVFAVQAPSSWVDAQVAAPPPRGYGYSYHQ